MSLLPLDNASVEDDVYIFPASSFQESLWLHDQLELNRAVYIISSCLRLTGPLDVSVLEQVLNTLVQRHETLRTTFLVSEGQLMQVISPTQFIALQVVDLRHLPQAEQEAEAQRLATAEAQRPFDLTRGPLLRTTLLQLAAEEHMLLLSIHHIIFDEWSRGVLCQELAALYTAFVRDQPSPLPELSIQYADFVVWQRQWLQDEMLASQLAYWRQQLSGAPALLELPTDHPRPAVQTFRGAWHHFVLSQELTDALKALSRGKGGTLFITLLAAFKVLLCRYTGQTDMVVGSPLANRNRSGTKGLIGFFLNTLVLRTDLSENPSFEQVLRRVREVALEAYAHQDLPFEKLVEHLNPERNVSHNPLFQVLFTLQSDTPLDFDLHELHLQLAEIDNQTAKFDLSLTLKDTEQGLIGTWEYSTDLFKPATISRMAGHFQTLLEGILANPEQLIPDLPVLTADERHQLLVEWNATQTTYPKDQCIHHLFEGQVGRTPDAVAVVFENQQLTYQQLNRRANQLAHHLQQLGVEPDVLVGLCIERSLDMVVGLLGILKAGGAYVPLDPGFPTERLSFMVEDAQVFVLVTQQHLSGHLAPHKAKVVCLDTDQAMLEQYSETNLSPTATSAHLAYVIYTSGSAGRPKGVQIIHHAVVNFLLSMRQRPGLRAEDTLLAVTTSSFDIAALELFLPLVVGARVVVASSEVVIDGAALMEILTRTRTTVMQATPATWRLLLAAGWQGNHHLKILCGGEALPLELAQLLLLRAASLWNLYGPTETTIWSSTCQIETEDKVVTIGRPIANTQLYILDAQLQLVPIGVPGQLYISGDGLARGYLNRPELTAESFISHPFSDEPGVRLYKTGDLARYRVDGTIEHLGRLDFQVKLRGFRIELGEIEVALMQHPAVEQAIVIVREDELDDKRLVAYIVVHQGRAVGASDLQGHVMNRLPAYMVPSAFVLLEAFPLTPNGKVDRRALPVPEYNSLESSLVMPQTPLQEAIAASWIQVLKIAQVGIHDNFFALGGYSLLAMQVLSHLRGVLQVELPLHRFFTAPTIAEFSQIIEQMEASEAQFDLSAPHPLPREAHRMKLSSLLPTQDSRDSQDEDQRSIPMSPWSSDNASLEEDVYIFPASFFQEGLWFHDQLDLNGATYNIPGFFRLRGPLDASVLEQVLHALIQRHETLRTTFLVFEGQLVQVISPTQFIPLQRVDLRHLPQAEQEAEVQRLVTVEAQRPFDLTHGPLLRTTLLQLAAEEHVLQLTIHHIISDEWSIGVFCQELADLYTAFVRDQPSPLLELPIQYADFVVWQRQWLQDEVLASQLSYWRQQLNGAPALLELPTDHPRPAVQTFRGAWHRFVLSQELTDALKALSRGKGVTLFMTLLAAFKVLLCRYTGQTDIVVGSPLANRNRPGTEGSIGLFVNMLVLRTDLSGEPSFEQVLRRVGEVALGAYAHRDLPFEKLVEQLNPERNLSHNPLFQVMFTLQSDPPLAFDLPGLHLQHIEIWNETAKFDLSLILKDTGQELIGIWEYSTDQFEAATISRMAGHFQTLLQGIVVNPEQLISDLPLLTAAERHQLLVEWNATQTEYPLEQCLHQLFEAQVERTPKAIAVVYEDEQLSYQELNAHANRLAHQLREHGVGPGRLVALLAERGIPFLISILAVFKAGGAYLPLDPHHPPARLRQVIELSQCSIVLVTTTFAPTLAHVLEEVPVELCPEFLYYEEVLQASQNEENLPVRSTPRDLAYVIYTSGSTGQPKGAMVEQRGMVNHISDKIESLALTGYDRVAQTASQCFVISVWQFLAALLVGGSVQIYPDEVTHHPAQLLTQAEHHQISILETVPSLMRAMLDANEIKAAGRPKLEALRWLITTGEALPVDLCQRWLRNYPQVPLLNTYGPTECSDDVAHYPIYEVPDETRSTIPIGRAIPNLRLYVLDRHLEPLPIGVSGELHVGGVGVGREYLGDEQRTKEAFVANPFESENGARLYKTGDLVRYLPDGNLEFLGRLDHQVKIRGIRIELGEIEAVLMQHPDVQISIVLHQEDISGDSRLIAYLTVKQRHIPSLSDLRSYLRRKLPDYMIPSAFMIIDALPLTPNGKVDRRALPKVEGFRAELETAFVAPQTENERTIAAIWQEVLGIKKVGIQDNFFDLGGNSLLLAQVHSKLQTMLKRNIVLLELFEYPTVSSLVEHLNPGQAAPTSPRGNPGRAEVHRESMRQQQQIRQKRQKKTLGEQDIQAE